VRWMGGKANIWLECVSDQVNLVDVLREYGVVIESATTSLLSMMRGTKSITFELEPRNGKPAKRLEFSRKDTPGFYLESAGFKHQDHTRVYVNRHAATLQSLALALILDLDPRMVFIDVLEGATEQDNALTFKLLSALAYKSGMDMKDDDARKELSEYARIYCPLEVMTKEDNFYWNVQQVNRMAAYFASLLKFNARSL
jgi:hypothetical protein